MKTECSMRGITITITGMHMLSSRARGSRVSRRREDRRIIMGTCGREDRISHITRIPIGFTGVTCTGCVPRSHAHGANRPRHDADAEQKTYFVSAGDRIGGVVVNKIFRDKAVIGKDGQEWELR